MVILVLLGFSFVDGVRDGEERPERLDAFVVDRAVDSAESVAGYFSIIEGFFKAALILH